MSEMFCFQCEQTAKGTGCTVTGVCGKTAQTSNLQDQLTAELVTLASVSGEPCTPETARLIVEGLFTTITNVSFDDEAIRRQIDKTKAAAAKLSPCACCSSHCHSMDMNSLWSDNEDIRSLKSLILLGMRGMAAYAYHALMLGLTDQSVNDYFIRGLSALNDNLSQDELLKLVMELGEVNLTCMALLDKANTTTYGTPVPTKVSTNLEKGPFIVISGHDLKDLELLLKQTEGKASISIPTARCCRPTLIPN